ncbi:hypothetical protein DB345_03830 [Spartobacteria bacterium LR76]|nr:hypothetical protein DB345_03830 [Spartobacteria bacterium LR76]
MDPYAELCRLRSTLEAFAAVRLAGHPRREGVFQRLQVCLAALEKCAKRGDYAAFHREDIALHRTMVESCEVPTLLESWEASVRSLDEDLLQVRKTYWPSLMALYREHVYLIRAWGAGDPVVVEQATHLHLEVGWYRKAVSEGRRPVAGSEVDRVASFLSIHHASEIDISEVAQNVAFLSPSQLTRRFHAQFGMAPYAWLRQVRLDRARQLLRTSHDKVGEIGRQVGYRNVSHFVRDFREHFAVTPHRWRSENRHAEPD